MLMTLVLAFMYAGLTPWALLGLFAGAIADRWPRRAVLVVTQSTAGALALILVLPDDMPHGTRCPPSPAIGYLGRLPKDAVIAGDPRDLRCVPVSARRSVVTSVKLAPSYEAAAFRNGRARMFADLRAVYGPSPAAITELSFTSDRPRNAISSGLP